MSKTFMLSSQVYLEECSNNYINIVVCNIIPQGPLSQFITRTKNPYISPFENGSGGDSYIPGTGVYRNGSGRCGLLALSSLYRQDRFLNIDEIPDLFSFLLSHGYTIDTQLTNMMNKGEIRFCNSKVICFATYVGQ